MTRKAYIVRQRIEHNGIDYNPWSYPFQQHVIFAKPHEILAALGVGAIEEDPSIPVPEETTPNTKESVNAVPKTLTPLLKPII